MTSGVYELQALVKAPIALPVPAPVWRFTKAGHPVALASPSAIPTREKQTSRRYAGQIEVRQGQPDVPPGPTMVTKRVRASCAAIASTAVWRPTMRLSREGRE
jgi:hypothetical protein